MKARYQYRNEDSDSDGSSSAGEDDKLELIKVHDNMVFFYESVNTKSVLELVKTLLKLKRRLHSNPMYKKVIYLFIQSDGGELFAGLSAMDHISNLGIEVRTVIDGFCASAATLIFLAGSTRYVMPHANILIHQLTTEFGGKYEELRDELSNTDNLMKTMEEIYTTKTAMPLEEIRSLLKRELHLSADQCLQYKIAHKIYKST